MIKIYKYGEGSNDEIFARDNIASNVEGIVTGIIADVIANGDKVKASIRFRGRELAHTNIGLDVMKRFGEACAEFGVIEKAPKLEGRQMLMFLAPEKKK